MQTIWTIPLLKRNEGGTNASEECISLSLFVSSFSALFFSATDPRFSFSVSVNNTVPCARYALCREAPKIPRRTTYIFLKKIVASPIDLRFCERMNLFLKRFSFSNVCPENSREILCLNGREKFSTKFGSMWKNRRKRSLYFYLEESRN